MLCTKLCTRQWRVSQNWVFNRKKEMFIFVTHFKILFLLQKEDGKFRERCLTPSIYIYQCWGYSGVVWYPINSTRRELSGVNIQAIIASPTSCLNITASINSLPLVKIDYRVTSRMKKDLSTLARWCFYQGAEL